MSAASVPPRLRRPIPAGFVEDPGPDAPEVSIVTVVRNGAGTIGDTLASVAAQTLPGIEHIVIDGMSTDGTCELVRRAPHRPRLFSEADHGIYDAFNKGLALARGRWITFLNADDAYSHERVVERICAFAAETSDVGVVHADMEYVDASGGHLTTIHFRPEVRWSFELEMPISHPTAFVARWVYALLGGFDATYRVAADYDLMLRVHLAGVHMRHLPEVCVRMREGGVSDLQERSATIEMMRSWYRCTGRPPWRQLARDLNRVHLLRWAPWFSRTVGCFKRRVIGQRVFQRAMLAPPPRRPSALSDRTSA